MNRIDKLFSEKKNEIMSVYFTAGFPKRDDTATIIRGLQQNGVDMIEIGMPFSDPMADGPVIQQSSHTALENGMSLNLLFEQLKDIRKDVTIPLLLMGYLNPVMSYGIEKFCRKAAEVGVDGIILPDFPLDEYASVYKDVFSRCNLKMIFLITPQTSEERIRQIDEHGSGFIYMVSTYSITGSAKGIEGSKPYFERMQKMSLKNPRMIGFGISDKQSYDFACRYASGAIIGTAFIKALEKEGTLESKIKDFVVTLRK